MAVGKWRVDFVMTGTRRKVASFECEIQRVSRYVSPKVGDVRIVIPIPNREVGVQAAKVERGAGMMTMVVYRNDQPAGWAFLDDTDLDSGDQYPILTCSGAGLEAYPSRRELRGDVNTTMDQTAWVKWFWDYIQGQPGGDIGVHTPTPKASGQLRKGQWIRSDTKTVGSVLKEMTNAADGCEWVIDCTNSRGVPRYTLSVGYPQLGRPSYPASVQFPGNMLSYRFSTSALDGAISFQARGKAPEPVQNKKKTGDTNPPPIMSRVVVNQKLINAGYTLTDATIDRPQEKSTANLDKWAALARDLRSGPLRLPECLIRIDAWSPAILGSVVTLKVSDFLWPEGPKGEPGFVMKARCIGYEIDPGEHGSEDVVKLIFENPQDADGIAKAPDS